jgi:hypothetical protein
MPLSKLQFRPGINREITAYSNEGGWRDCNLIRFRLGYPEKIGGWAKLTASTFLGTCRSLESWVTLVGERLLGIGTNRRFYYKFGDEFFNITPIRLTTSAGDVTFAVVTSTLSSNITATAVTIELDDASDFPPSGVVKIDSEEIRYSGVLGNILQQCVRGHNSTTPATHTSTTAVYASSLLVSDTGHGAETGAFVTFSGAVSLGGAVTATILNAEYEIGSVQGSDNYFVDISVFPNASDTGDGGASIVGAYEINPGPDSSIFGTGWGAGAWGRGTWGSEANITVAGANMQIWEQDNFGEDLLACIRDGKIYYWDRSATANIRLPNRMVELSSLSGSESAPTIAKQILVSDQDRHVIAFGCDGEFSIGTQDPLLIRFSDQESLTEWRTTTTTTAGELRIGSGSEIVVALETRQQILIFTDASLHAMQYLGPPFTFGLQELAYNTTIQGPNAAVAVNDVVYWMGRANFYAFTGRVEKIPCTVRDYVFNDLNENQRPKIFAGANSAFSEVFWFYPSADSQENNRYVVFNYAENTWYYGELSRTAWIDRGVEVNPLGTSDGYLYQHEVGVDADGVAMDSYIESSPIDVADGNNFMFVSRILPDVSFGSSTATSPNVSMTVKMQNFMGSDFTQTNSKVVEQTATAPVEQFTDQIFMRLRGRTMRFRVQSTDLGVAWRLGSPTIDIRTDGRR